jgi:hypothetical protein
MIQTGCRKKMVRSRMLDVRRRREERRMKRVRSCESRGS